MTQGEFDELLAALSRRLRLRAAASSLFVPVALLLGLDIAAVVSVKLFGTGDANVIALILTAGVLLTSCTALAALFVLRPVSRLRAAAELDRIAGLKERAASLVTVRAAGASQAALCAALEAQTSKVLAAVDPLEVRSGSAPLPARCRWLGVLLAVALAALLVPGRGRSRAGALADMLTDGAALIDSMNEVAEGGEDGSQQVETAKKALVLIKAPPPKDPRELERRRVELEELARELRKRGQREAAARLSAAFKELGGENGTNSHYGEGSDEGNDSGNTSHDRYPAGYRELLARYFEGS